MSLSRTIETPEIGGVLGQEPASRKHVLDLDDFSREEIVEILESSRNMKEVLGRDIKKVPALRGKVVVTLFYEASTRTRISFEEAGKVLSADVINMSASGSSTEKGESLLNTGLTIQAMGVDTIVIRHPHSGAPHLLAQTLDKVSIINAGDGLHAHPTQALLDLYTVQDKLGDLEGKKSSYCRRRAPQPCRPLGHLGLRQDGRQSRPIGTQHSDAARPYALQRQPGPVSLRFFGGG